MLPKIKITLKECFFTIYLYPVDLNENLENFLVSHIIFSSLVVKKRNGVMGLERRMRSMQRFLSQKSKREKERDKRVARITYSSRVESKFSKRTKANSAISRQSTLIQISKLVRLLFPEYSRWSQRPLFINKDIDIFLDMPF